MIIENIDIYHLEIPLREPFRTASTTHTVRGTVLARFQAQGLCGWGEASSGRHPHYSPESAATQFCIITQELVSTLLQKNISSGTELQALMKKVKGNQFAKAVLDHAWWDLHAQKQKKPLWKLIGGEGPEVTVGADFGVKESIEELLVEVDRAVTHGYTRVKLKCKPGWDVDVVRAVRQRHPQLPIHIDCNSGYTLADRALFHELDREGLVMLEQPLAYDDLIDHATLQQELQTPLCLDESITSVDKARKALALGACKWINIKPGRVGGLTNAIAIHNLAHQQGVGCWVGGMFESAIGQSFALALQTLPNMLYPADILSTAQIYGEDLGTHPIEPELGGTISAVDGYGIAVKPRKELLERYCVNHMHIA